MKTPAEWHALWRALYAQHEAPLPEGINAANIAGAERSVAARVDAACRAWIRTDEWPAGATPTERYFLSLRIVIALDLATRLLQPVAGKPAWEQAAHVTDDAMCEWFLISAWPCGWQVLQQGWQAVAP